MTTETKQRCEVCGEEYTKIHVEVGMCIPCRRWRPYGKPCLVCGSNNLDFRQVIVGELKRDFAELVMLTQDVLFDSEPFVKEAVDPRKWANMTNSWMRQRIEVLRGLAAVNGLRLPRGVQAAVGREVTRTIDGEDWECLETPNGLVQLRKVEGLPEGDFLCRYCNRVFSVRIAWYKHEPACKSNPVVMAKL